MLDKYFRELSLLGRAQPFVVDSVPFLIAVFCYQGGIVHVVDSQVDY